MQPLIQKTGLEYDRNARVAVLTGATGMLGATIARELASRGVPLALLANDASKLKTLASSIAAPDACLFTRTVDLLDPAETRSAAEAILARFGRIDMLLHMVGGWVGGRSLLEVPPSDLTFMLNQHVWTSFNVVQAFVPHLIRNGWGRVIMVSSPYAARPKVGGGAFAIGKAGQEALMVALAQELKGTGVTANLLQADTIDGKREKLSNPTPANSNWTTPEELSAAILYLLSEQTGTVNGAKIPMFGSF